MLNHRHLSLSKGDVTDRALAPAPHIVPTPRIAQQPAQILNVLRRLRRRQIRTLNLLSLVEAAHVQGLPSRGQPIDSRYIEGDEGFVEYPQRALLVDQAGQCDTPLLPLRQVFAGEILAPGEADLTTHVDFSALARAAGLAAGDQSDAELADALIAWVHAMNAQMGMPRHIKAIQAADFDRIVDHAFAEAHGTYGVPRYLDRSAARTLLQALMPD